MVRDRKGTGDEREAITGRIMPDVFTCAICGGEFPRDAETEAEALAEARANGFDVAECGLVCDACYRLTPWGQFPGITNNRGATE